MPKYGLENMDVLLRKLCNSHLPFGGKVMVLGGDFRQCMPVQPGANRSELLDLSIRRSHLWKHFRQFSLTQNMRVDQEEIQFAEYLLKLGNGELPTNDDGEIEIANENLSKSNLIDEVFGNNLIEGSYDKMVECAILAPKNKYVAEINAEVIHKLPGDYKVYHSYDSVKDGVFEFVRSCGFTAA